MRALKRKLSHPSSPPEEDGNYQGQSQQNMKPAFEALAALRPATAPTFSFEALLAGPFFDLAVRSRMFEICVVMRR
jgi:hypothetical protein